MQTSVTAFFMGCITENMTKYVAPLRVAVCVAVVEAFPKPVQQRAVCCKTGAAEARKTGTQT